MTLGANLFNHCLFFLLRWQLGIMLMRFASKRGENIYFNTLKKKMDNYDSRMKCLIIAAGLGSRLSAKGNLKPLIKLKGISLIERVITTAKESGVNDFYVVVGYRSNELKDFLIKLKERLHIQLTTIDNLEWEKPNGVSVLKAKEFIKDNFFLTMTDHIYNKTLLKKFQKAELKNDEVILGVDFNIKNNPYVDLDDVTKVLVINGLIEDIGKDIKDYNAFDTGVFYCSPSIFNSIEESSKKQKFSLSEAIKNLAKNGKARVFDIGNEFWIDVDDENAFQKAEELL